MANVTVFISYSRKDIEFAKRLKEDLRSSGAKIWFDHESLKPGEPDWEKAIRRGIEAATAVVYIGSPDAAQSVNVGAEVKIATDENRRIIPIWARG
ncbi:MAG TPA: toll/interleukin-1 receptor domain-containing protein, partial [Ktedonobacterales bacterium]|nr:toll/interleukin-1 receptor domain-containing protein [Ktedonobacterales bacterium]